MSVSRTPNQLVLVTRSERPSTYTCNRFKTGYPTSSSLHKEKIAIGFTRSKRLSFFISINLFTDEDFLTHPLHVLVRPYRTTRFSFLCEFLTTFTQFSCVIGRTSQVGPV